MLIKKEHKDVIKDLIYRIPEYAEMTYYKRVWDRTKNSCSLLCDDKCTYLDKKCNDSTCFKIAELRDLLNFDWTKYKV
jgi:hypothetical protein